MKKDLLGYPYYLWILIFIFLPLVLVVYFSLISKTDGSLTLENYYRFLDPIYLEVFYRSIFLSLISTLICLLIGYPMAWILANMEKKKRSFWVMLIIIPMWMNFLLRTYAWMTILEKKGLINSILNYFGFEGWNLMYNYQAVILGMVYNFLPFMILPIFAVLTKIDRSLIEAAEDLGADKKTVFLKVILPLSVPGIISGSLMTFMPAVTTFVISKLLSGGKITLIGNLIEQQFMTVNDSYFGSALSMILMIFVLLIVVLLRKNKTVDGGGLF